MNDCKFAEEPQSWWKRLTQAMFRDPAMTLLDTHDTKNRIEDQVVPPLCRSAIVPE